MNNFLIKIIYLQEQYFSKCITNHYTMSGTIISLFDRLVRTEVTFRIEVKR